MLLPAGKINPAILVFISVGMVKPFHDYSVVKGLGCDLKVALRLGNQKVTRDASLLGVEMTGRLTAR
jgi:hypothetical protein